MVYNSNTHASHVPINNSFAERNHLWHPQNQLINHLPATFLEDGLVIDDITGNAILKRGSFTLYINQYSSLSVKALRASFHRMFSAILVRFSDYFPAQKTIKFPLRDYMKLCNIESIDRARIQLNDDLQILYQCSVAYQSTIKVDNYSEMRLCQDFDIKNSVISITFGDKFFDMLVAKNMKRMLVPIIVLQCNFRDNPNSFFLGRKLSEYERINFNKKHNCVISVKTLLKACPNLKNWAKSKQRKRDIVRPFERDMNFLEDQIRWEYCNAKGFNLTAEQIDSIADEDFKTFIELYIKYAFSDAYTNLMEANIKPLKTLRSTYKKK